VEIRFLGTHNSESRDTKLVSFVIDDFLAVDAGSLTSGLSFMEQENIETILLSHGHYDHIKEVPTFAFNNRQHATKVFATRYTLEVMSTHLIDGLIYPKFAEKDSFVGKPTLELCPLEPFEPASIKGYQVLAMPVNHPIDTVGFKITSPDGEEIFYTADTGPDLSSLWKHIRPSLLIADMTYPNRYATVAIEAGHMCPQMLERELVEFHHVKGYLPEVALIHLSPQFEEEIRGEVEKLVKELAVSIKLAREGERLII